MFAHTPNKENSPLKAYLVNSMRQPLSKTAFLPLSIRKSCLLRIVCRVCGYRNSEKFYLKQTLPRQAFMHQKLVFINELARFS